MIKLRILEALDERNTYLLKCTYAIQKGRSKVCVAWSKIGREDKADRKAGLDAEILIK